MSAPKESNAAACVIEQAPVLAGLLRDGLCVTFTARGRSMFPFIPDGSAVTVAPVESGVLRAGTIVFYERPDRKQVALHRLIRLNADGLCEVRADGEPRHFEIVAPEHILGYAVSKTRGNKKYRLDTSWARRAGLLWHKLQPVLRLWLGTGRRQP